MGQGLAGARINFEQIFAQPTFLIPPAQKTWEAKYDANEGRPWKMPASSRYAEVQPWEPHRVKPADQNDLLKAVMKVPQAETAKNELTWKVQVALDHAWHHNASKWPDEPDGYGIKFPADLSEEPVTGSSVGPHLRRHAYEFVEDNPNRAILLGVAVGYTGYLAGMYINPQVPQFWPDIPLAIPGTRYRVPGMTLRINYINDFQGTAKRRGKCLTTHAQRSGAKRIRKNFGRRSRSMSMNCCACSELNQPDHGPEDHPKNSRHLCNPSFGQCVHAHPIR